MPGRIVFFVSSMEGGGAERVAALLCNHWARRGHEVTLVPTYSGRGGCGYPLEPGVELAFLADRVGATRRSPISMLARLREMRRIVRRARADAVVSFLPRVNVATVLATRRLATRVVVSERIFPPLLPLGPVWSLMRRLTYPHATAVVMQTRRALAWLERAIPGATGAVIPNPCVYPVPAGEPVVDPDDWLEVDRGILLGVGRLDEQKGFDLLVAAFARLAAHHPDWDLVILGEGDERARLERSIAAHGLSGRVRMPGRVGNVGDWYRRADIYVMSSRFEGYPNTLLEAMAHGVPAVSFDCETGPAEIVCDGVDGNLVPLNAGAAGLAEAVASLVDDDNARQRLSTEALTVRERYSMDRIGQQWETLVASSAGD